MKLRYKIGFVLTVLGAMFLWGRCSRTRHSAAPAVLPQNDKEQIVVDPKKHQLIIRNSDGKSTITTLPDKTSVIDIRKDGSVKVTASQYGFEVAPYIGMNQSNIFRFMAGSDIFYWKRLDVGLGLAMQKDLTSFVFCGKLSYTLWSNTQIGFTVDNKKNIGVALTVRL